MQVGRDAIERELDLAERSYHREVRPRGALAVLHVLGAARLVKVGEELRHLERRPRREDGDGALVLLHRQVDRPDAKRPRERPVTQQRDAAAVADELVLEEPEGVREERQPRLDGHEEGRERVDLRDDELVDVEELGQPLLRQVRLRLCKWPQNK